MTTDNDHIKKSDAEYEIDTITNKRLLKDHEYDGIRELDNQLPSWWKWLFLLTIVFSVVYLIRLWVFRADDLVQRKEFEKEMANAKENAPKVETLEIALLTDALLLQMEKKPG
jgi:cytochrome c oxidase cbb3-type subunit III